MLKQVLHEALFHFLLLGAAQFGVYRYLPPQGPAQLAAQAAQPAPAPSRQIFLTLDQLTRVAIGFQAHWGREPTAQELDRMAEDNVKEEILYREGLALGLDKDDEIVRRGMAQKMQFLAEDVAAQHAPTDTELRAWFDQNKRLFEEPPRLGFAVIGEPKIAFVQSSGGPADDVALAHSMMAAIRDCTPMRFLARLDAAIAGRVLAIRFIGPRRATIIDQD
jgi:hypothetical protein